MDQWINQGKYALNWNRRSCHKFLANQVRLELFLLAYNLGNFMRRLALPEDIKHWWMTSLQTRMIKTSGRLVRHARRLVFRLTEVLVTEVLVTEVLVTEVLVTEVLVTGNGGRDAGTDQPDSAGSWLAYIGRPGMGDRIARWSCTNGHPGD